MAFDGDTWIIDNPPMAAKDKARIHVLATDESAVKWDQFVSRTNRHLMLLDDAEWPQAMCGNTPFFCYQNDWTEDSPAEFCQRLQSLRIPAGETIYFFWGRESCVKTAWDVFARNWMNFLFEDEGCIVVAEQELTSLVLCLGRAWVGHRREAAS